jgi:hypothetical protein
MQNSAMEMTSPSQITCGARARRAHDDPCCNLILCHPAWRDLVLGGGFDEAEEGKEVLEFV